MLRFSWMLRHSPALDHKGLLELTEELDSVGYESVLLTVHSRAADYIPIVSRIMDQDFSIKYMLAVRPYLLSPQFFTMLLGGMQSIAKDRLMINWVHGTLGPKENFNAVLDIPEDMKSPKVRKKHMQDFIYALDKTSMFDPVPIPESLISGGSEEVLEMAKEFDMHLGTGYDIFLRNYDRYVGYKFKKIFVQVSLLIRDTDEEALLAKQENFKENINIIYGSPHTVENELIRIYSLGATDLLVSNSFYGGKEERQRIHDLVTSMKKRGVAE